MSRIMVVKQFIKSYPKKKITPINKDEPKVTGGKRLKRK